MADLTYFDCNVLVGPRPMKHRRERWSTEHLLEDMELAEIAGALAVHSVATTYDPVYGNSRLHAEVAKAPDRLFPAWCIAPVGSPGSYISQDTITCCATLGARRLSSSPINHVYTISF